jgi:predicted phosphodiesterase
VGRISDELRRGSGYALLGGLLRVATKRLGANELVAYSAAAYVPGVTASLMGHSPGTAMAGASVGAAVSDAIESALVKPVRMVFWSDDHGTEPIRSLVYERMAAEPAVDLFVFGGDAENWDRWTRSCEPLRKKAPVVAVPGNHDAGPPAQDIELPAVLELANVDLVLLGDPPKLSHAKLAASRLRQGKPTLVVCHQSPIRFSEEAAGASSIAAALAPLIERGCVILCGHQHVYGWGGLGRANVVSAGIAGSKHYTCRCRPPCVECDEDVRGYLRVDVRDNIGVQLVAVTR